jgi:hypothetical protein
MEVKRFDPYYISDQGEETLASMTETDDGDWVRYSDYAALARELERIEIARRK